MARSFTYFPRLPAELRRMIWEFCIPRRVVELEIPIKSVLPETNCDLSWTNRQTSASPLITRVCRESRKVALENGGPLQDYSEPIQINFNWKETDAWFCPKYDIVAWYWRHEQQVDYELEVAGDPLSYFVHYAMQAQGALILAHHIYPFLYFNPSGDAPPALEEVDLMQLSRLKSIMVCVKMLGIHVTAEEATESNLWGVTGEEMIQMVDATDADTIRKFSTSSKADDKEAKINFDLMVQDEYRRQLMSWKRQLTTWWIWQHWMVAFRRRFEGISAPSTIWVDNLSHVGDVAMDMLHPLAFWAPEVFPFSFDMVNFVENKDHPWVAQILKTMPDFRPVLMFRLCHSRCQKEFMEQARY